MRRSRRWAGAAVAVMAVVVVALAGCSSTTAARSATTAESTGRRTAAGSSTTAAPAAEHTVWLCRPGLAHDPCAGDLDATAVALDGTKTPAPAAVATDPKVDCFYVYPTVSAQPGPNADLTVDPEERGVAVQQAARFSQICRVFAPMYRQLTLSAILDTTIDRASAQALAYQDVLTAWQEYLRDFNHGRGVVFIGHSQGSFMLTKLLAEQVDPSAAERKLLVSALLMGGNVRVPVGKAVGGDFQHIPACASAAQTGCLIAYSTFGRPPPTDTFFGKATASGLPSGVGPVEVVCTNPAALGGGSGPLDSFIETGSIAGTLGGVGGVILGPANLSSAAGLTTPWVEWSGRYSARCVDQGGSNVLMVTPTGAAPALTASPTPQWGLHVVDVNLALGNLVDDVHRQAAAFGR